MPNWFYDRWIDGREVSGDEFIKTYLLGEWQNDAVYSREEISKMLKRGEISEARADAMLRMRYTMNKRGEKIIESERA